MKTLEEWTKFFKERWDDNLDMPYTKKRMLHNDVSDFIQGAYKEALSSALAVVPEGEELSDIPVSDMTQLQKIEEAIKLGKNQFRQQLIENIKGLMK